MNDCMIESGGDANNLQNQEYLIVDEILAKNGYKSLAVIAILQDVQKQFHYLPQELLEYIAKKIGISVAKIYSIATFYENFSLKPKGKYVIRVCDGTACHVRKSIPILQALRESLGLDEKKVTTEDMLFTIETVSCLGACGLAPVITVNDRVFPAMTPDSAKQLLNELWRDEK
ncbi:MAG: NAD(P)H-dependent oxidoreductase subunit E [Eubacteriales bacterium]